MPKRNGFLWLRSVWRGAKTEQKQTECDHWLRGSVVRVEVTGQICLHSHLLVQITDRRGNRGIGKKVIEKIVSEEEVLERVVAGRRLSLFVLYVWEIILFIGMSEAGMVMVVIVWYCEWKKRTVESGENARWQNREMQEAAFELVRRFGTDWA
ncbi:uncharacterized protein MONOS_17708 [Monocercomonoides exilis]|uniref:uncharacterized protein n=1 Tax=Monocercomonoides exilis TaxID=2049356 RepID=UPI003559FC4E|nr:hypothetical protein MONOS_17708 [Monocercomonoides exilis]